MLFYVSITFAQSNRKSVSHFALYRESVYYKNELSHWQVMLRKTELFETTSQLNHLIHKMIHCFESARADDSCCSKQ